MLRQFRQRNIGHSSENSEPVFVSEDGSERRVHTADDPEPVHVRKKVQNKIANRKMTKTSSGNSGSEGQQDSHSGSGSNGNANGGENG